MGIGCDLTVALPIQLAACGLEMSGEWSKTFGSFIHMGGLEVAPGLLLWIGSALDVVASWGCEPVDGISFLCLSFLYICFFSKNKKYFKKSILVLDKRKNFLCAFNLHFDYFCGGSVGPLLPGAEAANWLLPCWNLPCLRHVPTCLQMDQRHAVGTSVSPVLLPECVHLSHLSVSFTSCWRLPPACAWIPSFTGDESLESTTHSREAGGRRNLGHGNHPSTEWLTPDSWSSEKKLTPLSN